MLAQGLWVDGILNGTEKRKQENSCSSTSHRINNRINISADLLAQF